MDTRRIVLAITGATGAILGVRLLEELNKQPVETHVVISPWGEKTIALETDYSLSEVEELCDHVYQHDDMAASLSSGSFRVGEMVICPCSMKTLASIAHGYAGNLIVRSADVALKERRRLILVPRETPLHYGHLENMMKLHSYGAVIAPPMPAFYFGPQNIEDLVNHFTGRILDLLNLEHNLCERWG